LNITLKNPVPLLREENYFILAEQADVDAKEYNGDAQSVNVATGEASQVLPLQAFYKWFGHLQDTTQAEYDQAKKEYAA